MPLYFLRHGQTYANADHRFAGQRHNTDLTALGIRQAQAAAAAFSGMALTRIISSDLARARQTAAAFAAVYGFSSANIEVDKRVNEFDMGSFTGTAIRPVSAEALASIGDAESLLSFRDRILDFFREHKQSTDAILVVSHSGVALALESLRTAPVLSEFYGRHPYPNGYVTELVLDWLE
jgi:broad specificity phosphatase PhoE